MLHDCPFPQVVVLDFSRIVSTVSKNIAFNLCDGCGGAVA